VEDRGLTGRAAWTSLDDDALVGQCEVDLYRASGPGGQKRNKTSSAVRLRHPPSGLIVIAEESRSQHDNRARALKRLKRALWLSYRQPPPPAAARMLAGGWPTPKSAAFLPTAAIVLDMLDAMEGRVADAARELETGSAALADFLRQDEDSWREAAQIRQRHGLPVLR
jgi:hypothetical protein